MDTWPGSLTRIGPLPRFAALLLAPCLALAGCATTPPPTGRFLLHPIPVPVPVSGYSMSAGALVYADKNVEVEVRPVDQRHLARVMKERGLSYPFPAGPEPEPLVFEVRIRNRGKGALYFNPAAVRATDDEKERYLPVGVSDLYLLIQEEEDAEARFHAFETAFWINPSEIRPGGEVKKYVPLLSYELVPKLISLDIPLMLEGHDTASLPFVFEAFPAEGVPEKK
jgi:hypothetical protein